MSTPYMSLNLPVPTVTLGPAWAEQLNTALELVDSHDHTTGKGRLITPSAMNINADLPLGDNNLTGARSYNMQSQALPIAGVADIRSLYAVGNELFYNDGLGNQIQLTLAGAINDTTTGGITGDYTTSPGTLRYDSLSQTFYFEQDTVPDYIRAHIAAANVTVHEPVANSNGITLKSPVGVVSAYDITLPPAQPLSKLPVIMDTNGELSLEQVVASQIATDAVETAKIKDDAVTQQKLAPGTAVIDWVRETFTANGTWTRPAGVNNVLVRVIAAGGGGGGGGGFPASGGDSGGAGGSGGAAGQIVLAPANVTAASYTITVGALGTGGAAGPQLVNGSPGVAGGNSSFVGSDASITALGGSGGSGGQCGQVAASSTGGVAVGSFTALSTMTYKSGAAGNGRLPTIAGDAGSVGESSPYAAGGTAGLGTPSDAIGSGGGGGGGAAALGAGGTGANARQGTGLTPAASPGGAGAGYGSGGGGGAGCFANNVALNNPSAGGNGAGGIVEVYYAAPNL